ATTKRTLSCSLVHRLSRNSRRSVDSSAETMFRRKVMNRWARNLCRLVMVFSIGIAGTRNVRAQSATTEQTAADGYYNAKDWQKAAPAYEALTKANPTNGQDWYRW